MQNRTIILTYLTLAVFFSIHGVGLAEGTKQLEPLNAPSNSLCRLTLSINDASSRIPFALVNCSEVYRLNIRISNFTTEKIYFGFGNITEYGINPSIMNDVNYQVKDPAGNIVAGYSLSLIPHTSGDNGFIETNEEAQSGPNINNTNQNGYSPLIIDPEMNGDYILEFSMPTYSQSINRSFEYFDVTVAQGNTPIPGRLWSKAWQLSSGSVNSPESASFAMFYIYSNDSIATSFDSNGLAGGIWTIYSNESGCATTGTWSNRRSSVEGNATVQPQYKIFLNDPDSISFPTGIIGEMIDATVLPHVCDTAITFTATVSKAGNIEILIDVPPLNPNTFGPEDVQLGYSVEPGYNILLPAWDAKNAYGIPLTNGTQVEARINFLNGLTNIPLYDVEDNPYGFKVNILRPMPATGNSKLKLFWDDTKLPPNCFPTSNVLYGCEYTGSGTVTGCHDWDYPNSYLGEENTINSWWYYTNDNQLLFTIELELLPRQGSITGPDNICAGQLVTFSTSSIPFAPKYIWHLSGPGTSVDVEKDAPDSTFTYQFTPEMPQGQYVVSVYGLNPECGNGEIVYFDTFLFDEDPPPIIGFTSACTSSTSQVEIAGSYLNVQWSVNNGEILGSPEANPATILWHSPGPDTIEVYSVTATCGTRLSKLPIMVYPTANVGFNISEEATSCPGLSMTFTDTSSITSGTIFARNWIWDDGLSDYTYNSEIAHSFANPGNYNVQLTVTTDNGCQSEAIKQINIIPYPVASFSIYSNCISQLIELQDNSTGVDLVSWSWDFGNAPVTASNLNLRQPTAEFHQSGLFPVSLVVTNKYKCIDTVIQQIRIHNPPVAAYTNEYPCQSRKILFSDQCIPTDTSLVQYLWNVTSSSGYDHTFEGTPTTIVFDEVADYEVALNVMDAFGCIGSISSVIDVKPKPLGSFNYIENWEGNQGIVRFVNLTSGATNYYWDFGNSSTSTLFEPETMYTREDEYNIMLISKSYDGCTDTTNVLYYYIPGLWMPNSFTPNNDGLNDILKPITNRTTLAPYLLQIYNRWGQLIFESSEPDKGWDGKFNGNSCETGTYLYILQYRQGELGRSAIAVNKGLVTLLK